MAYTEKETERADLLVEQLRNAVGSFDEMSQGFSNEGLSIRVAILASARLLASFMEHCDHASIDEEEMKRRLARLAAQQLEAADMNEDDDAADVLALDDCGLTPDFLGEAAEPCPDCGEYHHTHGHDNTGDDAQRSS